MADAEKEGNSVSDLKKFLSTPENPVTMAEFNEFWKELTDEEKEQFRKEQLPPSS